MVEPVNLDTFRAASDAAKDARSVERSLKDGGGGGTFDGMEARIASLEKRFDRLEDKVDKVGLDLATVKGEVSRLPGYPGLFVICATLVGIVTLLIRFLPAA